MTLLERVAPAGQKIFRVFGAKTQKSLKISRAARARMARMNMKIGIRRCDWRKTEGTAKMTYSIPDL